MDKDYKALMIGSLLHDIGKFIQRAKNPRSKSHEEFGYKYLKNKFEEGFLTNLDKETKKKILNIVKEHHNDKIKRGLVGIVRLADWLSSGERESPKTYEEIYKDKDIEILNSNKQKLMSIFEILRINEEDYIDEALTIYNNEITYKYECIPLKIHDEVIFARESSFHSEDNTYYNLLTRFNEELKEFSEPTFEELYQLIQKYMWCIPSVTLWKKGNKIFGGIPDISLFDHLKTTCAIACCLYNLYKDGKLTDDDIEKLLKNNKKLWNKPIFSLIHGDISGIQNFIFTISSKYAIKSLKGRSFYLDFLTEYLAKYICKELNLPIANILYYGGGHFYILSYLLDDNKINEFEKKINDTLYNMFKTKIYVTIEKYDVTPNNFKMKNDENFAKIWRYVADVTLKKKFKKFSYKISEIFKPYGSEKEDKCKICNRDIELKKENENKEYFYLYEENNKEIICKYCASFIMLTEILKKFEINKKIEFNKEFEIKHLKIKTKFSNIPAIKELIDKLGLDFNDNNYWLDTYYLPHDSGELIIPYKIWSIAFPLEKVEEDEDSKEYKIRDFDTLANLAYKRTGTNKIAILKMDVDYLGTIFTQGLGKESTENNKKIKSRASISRMSTLSSMLTLFFTGYIPHLINTGKTETVKINGEPVRYKDYIYLVYSGGDDTLIVGSWDVVIDLAKRIRKNFSKFVCYNPDITLSAGIVLIDPKFEFKKAVNIAEEELETAKGYSIYEDDNMKIDKNALSIFESPMNWYVEVYYNKEMWEKWKKLQEIGILPKRYEILLKFESLVENINENELEKRFENALISKDSKISRRLLHISQNVADRLNKVINKKNNGEIILNLPYYWRMLYYLYRNYKNNNKLDKNVKFIEDYLKSKVMGQIKSPKIKFSCNDLKVAAKIVELKTREGEKNA
ncbi:CRISPR system single-strand-specific deoxyribonuclease Cas10/Csm1 (subtype III-A) [Methanocaldococcus lauensis]|uniref:CRISPR system single-strand-specific deoxyribonuclease Cas10/Csm1 (subtype III-A) n=1 Tax=Methanocaldococcus lauensis TaxID=2546128 RepID=A0A8D6PVI9_9EURY|nr:type III-A CRISPR-associated protein Cas10/Csm1 [Methanocaldococcus lauensis]CAB3289519.1 CRISPR system single-strand-specific deoxyribonuclease Cas10/Csm1 (subtype III-A) [Methanocaldococcus lauensis]